MWRERSGAADDVGCSIRCPATGILLSIWDRILERRERYTDEGVERLGYSRNLKIILRRAIAHGVIEGYIQFLTFEFLCFLF